MKKSFVLSVSNLFFLRQCMNAFMSVKVEEDLAKKFAIFNVIIPIVSPFFEKVKDMLPQSQEAKDAQKQMDAEKITIEMESHLIDFLKGKWKEVPAHFKSYNAMTGAPVGEGLNSETEIKEYMNIKEALESATPLTV